MLTVAQRFLFLTTYLPNFLLPGRNEWVPCKKRVIDENLSSSVDGIYFVEGELEDAVMNNM